MKMLTPMFELRKLRVSTRLFDPPKRTAKELTIISPYLTIRRLDFIATENN